jgi:hypothetical protein
MRVPAGFLLTIPAINCVRNIFPNSSKFQTDFGGSFLYQSLAFPYRVNGKA